MAKEVKKFVVDRISGTRYELLYNQSFQEDKKCMAWMADKNLEDLYYEYE